MERAALGYGRSITPLWESRLATFAGSADYSSGCALATFTITAARPSLSVIDASGIYTGRPFTAIAKVNGGTTLDGVGVTLHYYSGSYTSPSQLVGRTPLTSAPSAIGTYTVVATFAGCADYSSGCALATFTISAEVRRRWPG